MQDVAEDLILKNPAMLAALANITYAIVSLQAGRLPACMRARAWHRTLSCQVLHNSTALAIASPQAARI